MAFQSKHAGGVLVPNAPRYPFWSCGLCGCADNWGDRASCRRCQREPPFNVKRRQREAQDNKKMAGTKGRGGGQGGGGDAGGGGGGPGGKGSAAATRASSSSRSYADAAQGGRNGGNSSNVGASSSVAIEIQELKKSNERLVKQLAELRAASSPGQGTGDEDELDDDGGEQERDDRIKVLQSNLQALVLVYGENSPEHRAKRDELEALQRAKREGKPLKAQLHNVDKRIVKQKQKVDKLEIQVGDLQERLKDVQEELAKSEEELADARKALESTEDERRALLLREAQAQSEAAGSTGNPSASKQSRGEAEWTQLVSLIKERAAQPGVHQELSRQVGAAVDLLRTLCGQLPSYDGTADGAAAAAAVGTAQAAAAARPCTGSAAAATGAQHNGPAIPPQQPARQPMGGPGDDPIGARAGQMGQAAAVQPSHPVQTMATEPVAPMPADAGRSSSSSSASAAGTPAAGESAGTSSTLPPTAAAAAAATANENSDFESSEEFTDGGRDDDVAMEEVESEIAAITSSPADREKIKQLLHKRQAKTAQRRSGPKRLKKAGKEREVHGDGPDPKKPAK